jgi:methyl-accepting chemotaxis protein
MKSFRRRHFFIDKHLQTKYLLLTILLLLSYSLIFVILIFLPYILPIHFNLPLEERAEAARVLLALNKSVWPALLVAILILGVLSIFITHKIVGPIYRLKKALGEMIEGNLDVRVTLRKGDDLQELADHVNQLSAMLSTSLAALKHNYDTLSSQIDELERQIEAKSITPETGRELIRQIDDSRKTVVLALERFRVTP